MEDGYNELLKVLKNNPPYIESHVKALEIEVYCLSQFRILFIFLETMEFTELVLDASILAIFSMFDFETTWLIIAQVQLAQKQFEDMCEHRNALYHSTETVNDSKVKDLLFLFFLSFFVCFLVCV